jgi:TM2 domain-containing membrane protein YozV
MNCAYHPELQADAYCRTCGKPLCTACKRDVKGVIYCEDCIASRVIDTMPPAVPLQAGATAPGAANPAIATLLGFIPGVGQMYNGQFAKSFALIFIFAALIWGTNQVRGDADVVLGFGIFAVYAYMVFDAYKTARAKELGEPLPDPFGLNSLFGESSAPTPRPAGTTTTAPAEGASMAGFVPGAPGTPPPPYIAAPVERRSTGPIGAFVLIAIGVLFLLGNLDIFDFDVFHRFWPVIIIAVGVWMFFRRRPACQCQRCQTACLMGPAMVTTVGVLLLLAETTRFGVGHTWPVFLLVLGGVKLLQANASTEGHVNVIMPSGPVVPPGPPSTGLTTTGPGAPSDTNSEVTNA